MDDPRSLEAQLLGDMTYDDPRKHQTQSVAPQPAVSAEALLGDMGGGTAQPVRPQTRYQELTDEQIAILQQQRAAAGQPAYTPDEIAELKAEFIERQRLAAQEAAMAQQAAQQQQAAAMLLEEPDSYQAPEKKPEHGPLPTVDASQLLEEPAPETEHRPVFNQEDLEAAKKQAAKRAAESLTEAPPVDEKEARRQMRELREQQLADLAQAGFPISIILTVVGIFSGLLMASFAGRPWGGEVDPEAVTGFFRIAETFYTWGGIIVALLSVTIVLRVSQLRGFTSFLFGASAFLLVIPGVVILMEKRGDAFPLTLIIYLLALIGCITVVFMMSTNDKLSAYYAHKDVMMD